jgi:hypothetical protein
MSKEDVLDESLEPTNKKPEGGAPSWTFALLGVIFIIRGIMGLGNGGAMGWLFVLLGIGNLGYFFWQLAKS